MKKRSVPVWIETYAFILSRRSVTFDSVHDFLLHDVKTGKGEGKKWTRENIEKLIQIGLVKQNNNSAGIDYEAVIPDNPKTLYEFSLNMRTMGVIDWEPPNFDITRIEEQLILLRNHVCKKWYAEIELGKIRIQPDPLIERFLIEYTFAALSSQIAVRLPKEPLIDKRTGDSYWPFVSANPDLDPNTLANNQKREYDSLIFMRIIGKEILRRYLFKYRDKVLSSERYVPSMSMFTDVILTPAEQLQAESEKFKSKAMVLFMIQFFPVGLLWMYMSLLFGPPSGIVFLPKGLYLMNDPYYDPFMLLVFALIEVTVAFLIWHFAVTKKVNSTQMSKESVE